MDLVYSCGGAIVVMIGAHKRSNNQANKRESFACEYGVLELISRHRQAVAREKCYARKQYNPVLVKIESNDSDCKFQLEDRIPLGAMKKRQTIAMHQSIAAVSNYKWLFVD